MAAADAALLAQLARAPADPATRMVYADWLEQHGFVALASFVRGDEEPADPAVLALTQLDWRAVTSRAPLACTQPRCPGTWDRLAPTEHRRVRSCARCEQFVVYCATPQEAANAGAQRLVAAFDLRDRAALRGRYDGKRGPASLRTFNPPAPRLLLPSGPQPSPFERAVRVLEPADES